MKQKTFQRSLFILKYIGKVFELIKKGDKQMKQDMIVILDLGSTQNTVVARQIRDMGVYSEIHPHDITPEELGKLAMLKVSF